jgi:antitoxin ParD1/3/4
MNVSLTPELEELVQNKVKSGRYLSASEVVREGLRLLDDHDRLREMKLEEVRKMIQVGFDQIDRGEGIPLEEVFDRLARNHEDIRKRIGK